MFRTAWEGHCSAAPDARHPLGSLLYAPTLLTFPLTLAAFRALARRLGLRAVPAAAIAPLEAQFAAAATIGIAVTATALTVALGVAAAASSTRTRRVFLLIASIHTSILAYTIGLRLGLDTYYPDVVGRPVSLLRSVSWTHSLSLFLCVLLQLSPRPAALNALYIAESYAITLLILAAWMAPAPWRHLAFASMGALVLRMLMWVRRLLQHVVGEMQGRLRHPNLLGVFIAYIYFCLALENAYVNVYVAGTVMQRIAVVTEWQAFLALDVVAKVLNPVIVAVLLEATAVDARQHGQNHRWRVRAPAAPPPPPPPPPPAPHLPVQCDGTRPAVLLVRVGLSEVAGGSCSVERRWTSM